MTALRVAPAAGVAVAIAFLIEFGQLIGILDMLGLRSSGLARVVFGSGFDAKDLLAYLAGAAIVLLVERRR